VQPITWNLNALKNTAIITLMLIRHKDMRDIRLPIMSANGHTFLGSGADQAPNVSFVQDMCMRACSYNAMSTYMPSETTFN
jgi:gamma-glutamylcysteine synthetase